MKFINSLIEKLARSIVDKQEAKEITVVKEVEVVKEIEVNSGPDVKDLFSSLNYIAKLGFKLSEEHEGASIMLLGGTGTDKHVSSIVGNNASLQMALMEACGRSEHLRSLICDVAQEINISEMREQDMEEANQRSIELSSKNISNSFKIASLKGDLTEDDVDDIINDILGPRRKRPNKDNSNES